MYGRQLTPGGYFEVTDILYTPKSDDGTLVSNSPLRTWANQLASAAREIGRPLIGDASEYLDMLSEAGFVDIHVVVKNLPTNSWPNDKTLKEIGKISSLALELETISMALFTHGLGWDPEAVIATCAHVREEFKSPDVHAYFPLIIVYGRKPCRPGSVEER